MINLFYNATERRLRALWRIMLHTLSVAFTITILTIPFFILSLGDSAEMPPPEALQSGYAFTFFEVFIPLIVISASLWLFGHMVDRRPFSDFGLWIQQPAWWRDLGFGLLLGAVLMLGVFLTQLALGWITITDTFVGRQGAFVQAIIISVLIYLSVGIYEEMWFRGYLLLNAAEGFKNRWISPSIAVVIAWVLSSSIFGVLHALNPNASLISTINIMFAGLLLGLGFVLTRSLAIPIGLHITWNFFQGSVFGFPVSGTTSRAAVFAIEQGGIDLWTGGAFGPEAGIIGLITIAIGILITLAYLYAVYGKVRLQTTLAAYTPHYRASTQKPSDQPVA